MKTIAGSITLLFFCLIVTSVNAGIAFEKYTQVEFSPILGQQFKMPIRIDKEAKIEIEILSSDGDLVKKIKSDKYLKAGKHVLVWDGKDSEGKTVPDEAYIPVLNAIGKSGSTERYDPRNISGGELVENLNVTLTATKDISYVLPVASRVLIRAGIQGGPMLRSLANWEPHGPGKNVQRWDGYDNNKLFDLRKEKNLSVLVTAFKLPKYTILTIGNKKLKYPEYHKMKRWTNRVVPPEKQFLNKGDVRISRHYYSSRISISDPEVEMKIKGEISTSSLGLPILKSGENVSLQVDIPTKDRWLMNETLYEVSFYIDNEFVAEEEQGYVPISWVWKPTNLKPGKHIVTTNVTGFSGKVGVASIAFEISE
jgi:hypothetical protein